MRRVAAAVSVGLLAAACAETPPVLPARAQVPASSYDAARSVLPAQPAAGPAQSVMLAAARRGVPRRRLATVGEVLEELARGHAVVLGQGLHAPAIAVGYDMPADRLLVTRGGAAVEPLPLEEWRPDWQGAARWAVALGPAVPLAVGEQVGQVPGDSEKGLSRPAP